MGWLTRLLGSLAKPTERVRRAAGEPGSAAEVVAELMRRYRAANDDGWVHLEAVGEGRRVIVQVKHDVLNVLLEELPAHAGEALGLERIETGLYRMADGSPEGVAATIDALLNVHFGLGAEYAVEGRVEG